MRSRQLTLLLLLAAFVLLSLYIMRHPTIDDLPDVFHTEKPSQPAVTSLQQAPDGEGTQRDPVPTKVDTSDSSVKDAAAQQMATEDTMHPRPAREPSAIKGLHPIDNLIGGADTEFAELLGRQSKTLGEAVVEYKRRYKMHPPPHFDKWYAYATKMGVQLIDEFDTVFDALLPFWGLEPATLRERVKETIGFDNAMMALAIRDGKVVNIENADEWQRTSTKGMMANFVKYLPDMDLAFNIHDEPRVILANDDLSRLIQKATETSIPESFVNREPQNEWTKASDIGNGKTWDEYKFTRFNVFAHQPTWSHSRQSCPPDSAARFLDDHAPDNTEPWTTPDGLFIKNKTAFSDVCHSPSLKDTFGFFNRPNALNIVQDLVPVFSQSKVSSFQDILYPSPWYWADKVPYHSSQDYTWEKKLNKLYWRGSTTGGYSRNGGWRRQHRQQIVGYINRKDNAAVLEKSKVGDESGWTPKKVAKADLKDLFDVHFSYVGQCDQGDCDAQVEYFLIVDSAKQKAAWQYKYLLDMDGNAFSGRWYAFLNSHSLPFKMAYFREWHEEWIKPWVHYVPLSLSGSEYYEALRYFDKDATGQEQARQIAEAGRQWAQKSLRNVDLEVWFFRLLLEYGRVIDDNRHLLGFKEI